MTATPALHRLLGAVRSAGAALLLAVLAAGTSTPARAALPVAGDVVEGVIEVATLRKLPLPKGRWQVVARFDDAPRPTVPAQHHLVLLNAADGQDVTALVLEFSSGARINSTQQPCDAAASRPNLLARNAFDTAGNSVVVRCNHAYTVANLRAVVQKSAGSSNAWVARYLAALAPMAGRFPRQALAQQGYLSRMNADWIGYVAYLNPAARGFDDAAAHLEGFQAAARSGDRATPAGRYLAALADWSEAYSAQLERYYLSGFGFGTPEAMVLLLPEPARAGTATAAAIPAPAATPPVVNPPPATPISAAPAPKPQRPKSPTSAVAAGGTAAKPAPPSARAHALVIGNSAYPGAPLANPRHDAEAVAQRLRSYGITVTLLLDATRQRLVQTLADFEIRARDADVVLLFYAGHGMQVDGVNYLIPIDLNLSAGRAIHVALEAVSLNALLESHLPGRTKLVFLDACRDNPLARSLAGTRGGSRGLAAVNAATGTLISYATRDGSTASDGSGRHSPYTSALLAHLDEPEDIALVLRRVRQKVMASTHGAQEPWEYGSLVGDKLVLPQLLGR